MYMRIVELASRRAYPRSLNKTYPVRLNNHGRCQIYREVWTLIRLRECAAAQVVPISFPSHTYAIKTNDT